MMVWRPPAKIVASLEVVRVGMGCLVFAFFVAGAIIIGPLMLQSVLQNTISSSTAEKDYDSQNPPDRYSQFTKVGTYFVLQWVLLAIAAIFVSWEVYITRKLLLACKKTCHVNAALKYARLWRNVKLVFLIVYPVGIYNAIQRRSWVALQITVCTIIWHFVALLVVQQFIKELESSKKLELRMERNIKVEAKG